ncbi:adenine deaminase C-terminal domain-containing protein [Frankia sp. AgB32]|uniref:adenine deaminase C-terminal domain-containing protein n=1 Tax=Frankia sp. AgB32 TaxID=631119 RepID=UPI0020104BA7|nr:adenine deaminase C-terminal domain-containing protein [Frankia sp. AgB32]MCK9893387.1 amidohydrolase family protein [Frankia sp. AgB32]
MNVERTSHGPRLMSTPHRPGHLLQAAAVQPANPRATPPQTQSPQVMPGADRPDVPAQPEVQPRVRLFGVDRLRASDAQLARMRRVASGEEDADLVVRGGLVVVVQDGSVVSRDVLIVGRHIAAVTRPGALSGRRSLDAAGRYVLPAYVDPGLRIEDTLLSPGELARLIVPRGTGTLLADPTALITLGGLRGPEFAAGSGTPLRVLIRSGGAPDEDLPDTFLPAAAGGGLAGMLPLDPGSADGLRRALEAAGLAGSRTVTELAFQGHIDHDVRLAVGQGTSPIDAIRRATLLPARAYGLDSILGAIAPARLADLQVVSSLADTAPPDVVVASGRIAAEHGRPLFDNLDPAPGWAAGRIQLPATLHAGSFAGPDLARPARADGSIAVVSIDAGAGPTIPIAAAPPVQVAANGVRAVRTVRVQPTVRDGRAVADATRDLQKIAILGRAGGTEPADLGLVRGCGLSRGALGFTTAQAPGCVVVIGTRDDDMLTAARAIEGMGGGFVVVDQGWVRAACPLPLLGLLSDAPWEAVLGELAAVDTAAADLGCRLPFPLRTLARLGSQLHTGP